MKKFLIFVLLMFSCGAGATTVSLDWTVDGSAYAQTTCQTGNNLSLPTPPTKYGYTFKGWNWVDTEITGTWSRTGTPTPENPIEPVFYENNGLILRALGADIADSYSTATGKVIRRVGVKVFDGTEEPGFGADNYIKSDATDFYILLSNFLISQGYQSLCNYFPMASTDIWQKTGYPNTFTTNLNQIHLNIANDLLGITDYTQETRASVMIKIKNYLRAQYINGTPIIVYYPLENPIEEMWNGQINN